MLPPPEWICIFAGIASNTLSGAGLVAQRKAKIHRDAAKTQPLWKSRTWLSGILLTISASPFDFVSYLGAPLFILALISCMRLPLIAILSKVMLEEKVGRMLYIGMSLCATGAFLVITHLPSHHDIVYPDYAAFFTPVVSCYYTFSLSILSILPFWMYRHPMPSRNSDLIFPFCAALALALSKSLNILLNKVHDPPGYQVAIVLAGILVLAICDFGLNVVGVQKVQPSIYAPIFFAFFNCLLLFQSFVIFDEFSDSLGQIPLTMFGAVLSLLGALMCRQSNPQLVHDLEDMRNVNERDSRSPRGSEGTIADVRRTMTSSEQCENRV